MTFFPISGILSLNYFLKSMRKPLLAIVGRPNVGKSALFNRLVGKRYAIVDEAEGITRDRLYGEGKYLDGLFRVVDTGGVDASSEDRFKGEIIEQAMKAVEEADVLLLVVDGKVGITAQDMEMAKRLLKTKKRVVLAVNKIDDPHAEHLVHAFHKLGIRDMIPLSAAHAYNLHPLLETVWKGIKLPSPEGASTATKIAIVGKPNVGKSTLVNALLGEERSIVSPLAGTTRDAIPSSFTFDGKEYELVDTAGLRRKKSEKEVVEKFAALRTEQAIEEADVVLLVFDAEEGLTEQEKRMATMIEERGKPTLLLCNKWDQIHGFRMEHCMKGVRAQASFLAHVPLLFISAKTGRNLEKIFPALIEVLEETKRRLSTHQLNKFLEKAMQLNHPPMLQGKRLRIYYGTQVDVTPPRFILFVNNPDLMAESYKKYLVNQFRKEFGFSGVPLAFHMKGKSVTPQERRQHRHQGPMQNQVLDEYLDDEDQDPSDPELEALQEQPSL